LCCFNIQKFDDHGKILDLLPGQLCITFRKLAQECGDEFTKDDIEGGLLKFTLYGFCLQQILHKKTVITIIHKDTYDLIGNFIPTTIPPTLLQDSSIKEERKERKEIKEKKQGGGVFFDRDLKEFKNINDVWIALMRETYLGVDIHYELKRMKVWLLDPEKTKRAGNQSFISNWLGKNMPKTSMEEPEHEIEIDEELEKAIRRRNEDAKRNNESVL
jgi:hypothetical protein